MKLRVLMLSLHIAASGLTCPMTQIRRSTWRIGRGRAPSALLELREQLRGQGATCQGVRNKTEDGTVSRSNHTEHIMLVTSSSSLSLSSLTCSRMLPLGTPFLMLLTCSPAKNLRRGKDWGGEDLHILARCPRGPPASVLTVCKPSHLADRRSSRAPRGKGTLREPGANASSAGSWRLMRIAVDSLQP
eukprot:748993-Hanusia_phi.AAC.2